MSTEYTFVGGADVALGPGDFPVPFPSLDSIPVQENDLILVAYYINGPLATAGGFDLQFPFPNDSLGNTFGLWGAAGEATGPVGEDVQFFAVASCFRSAPGFLGSIATGDDIVTPRPITLLASPGNWGAAYTSAFCSVAVYRKPPDPGLPGPFSTAWQTSETYYALPYHGSGAANGYLGALDAIVDTAPQLLSGFDPLTFPPGDTFMSVACISPGSGAPSGVWTPRGTGLFADAQQLTTLTVPGTNGILFLALNRLPSLSMTCPGNGSVGTPYTGTVGVSGGVPPYTVSIASGPLPPGLSLAPSGAITGIPAMAGSFFVGFNAVDSMDTGGSEGCTIVISGCGQSFDGSPI